MKKVCGDCRYLDICDKENGKAYCTELRERHFANDIFADDCKRFFSIRWGDESKSKKAIKEAEEFQRKYIGPDQESVERHLENQNGVTNSGCFITTALVGILGFDDDCEELGILRIFREHYLQKQQEYRDLLFDYDVCGPILAKALEIDPDSVEVAIDLYTTYIKGCILYIKKGLFDRALEMYVNMTQSLIRRYGPNLYVGENLLASYDHKNGGHGYIMSRKSND